MSIQEPVHLRRADTNERFVAFAFAGAEMMAETEANGTITYATGAFRSRFGKPADGFVGASVRQLIVPADREALDTALCQLSQRGRLQPMMVRLADAGRTMAVLAGIVMPGSGRPARLCLTFARPPEPAAAMLRPGGANAMARGIEAGLRAGERQELYLLEVAGPANGDTIGMALETVVPQVQAGELAPGRYGVLGSCEEAGQLGAAPATLEAVLRGKGIDVSVTATRLSLEAPGLTPVQAARALRQALSSFARDGVRGLGAAGLADELSGYMARAGRKADLLRHAIRETAFSLAFQPVVTMEGRVVHHYEALIRPKPIAGLELAGPQEFVMLVEAVGLAEELDHRIAALACDHASRAGVKVAFNISGQSVQSQAFRERFLEQLGSSAACRAGLMVVEMTETAEIEDIQAATLMGEGLRGLGVPFCLDDFGAGAADMRLLRALSPDIVKLDGSYVAGIARPGRERAFVAGMVEIARAVGAETVGERVETEEEAAALAALGVQFGQGWLFGRPAELPSVVRGAGRRAGEKESWG